MSLYALLAAAASLGLLGGLHCIAMCGALQHAAIGAPHGGSAAALRAQLSFQLARLAGYAALGALVAGGSSLLRWAAFTLPAFKPLWTIGNASLLALGLALLWLGRQPLWIDALGARVWTASRPLQRRIARALPLGAGFAWALLPCGLLYSALALAALASEPVRGALAMLAFGAGTAVNLLAARWLLSRVAFCGGSAVANAAGTGRAEAFGVRVAGAMLAAMALAALIAIALGLPHPFCS
ncbi:MAG TPA: sulfite exporter TauE/SafE family protein [Burkholderiaceae bacterium]|nr:sulfite exporter TauE/SafE family protein [Burkholderiaceae bacterium]